MLKRASLLALLGLCSGGVSWAQPVCDGPFTWGHCKAPESQSQQQNAAPEQPGNARQPVIVEVPSAEESKRRAAHEDEAEHAKAVREQDLVDATKAIAIVTGLLMVGTFVLAGFTGRLWRATSDLAESTANLVEAEKANSAELRKASDLAEKQFLMAGEQATLASKQHSLERKKLLIENRPRLRIRSIAIVPPNGAPLFDNGRDVKGSLVIVNNGGTDATILESGYRFYWSKQGLPIVPPLGPSEIKRLHVLNGPRLAGFGSLEVPIEGAWPADVSSRDVLTGMGWVIYVMGFIKYADWDETERYMGFCRRYMPANVGEGSFYEMPNPDYEYED
jgi:hypothetical protein